MFRKILILMAIPAPALAHPGPHDAGPLATILHALTAPDHLPVVVPLVLAAAVGGAWIALRRRQP
jgi:hydrogenase/urease accessory protein HupE